MKSRVVPALPSGSDARHSRLQVFDRARTHSGNHTMHNTPRIIISGVVLSSIGAFAIYRTTTAANRDAAPVIASGTVEATQGALGFQASGRLETITVREGDRVTTGAQ